MIVQPRLPMTAFRLPVEKIRAGYKTDVYFNRTAHILRSDMHNDRMTMQVFQKKPDVVVCGVDHALALLELGAGYYRDAARAATLFERYLRLERLNYDRWTRLADLNAVAWEDFYADQKLMLETSLELSAQWESTYGDLEIRALHDGETATTKEPILHITGRYSTFAHLETLYLGALAHMTKVATNTRDAVLAANGKPILMFGARHEPHELQAASGYAAHVGGAYGISTSEGGEWWGSKATGTVPHSLIAAYGGDTVLATQRFEQVINSNGEYLGDLTIRNSGRINLSPLVDFDNDVIKTSLEVAAALGDKLWGVRVDTSEALVDEGLQRRIPGYDQHGVTEAMVYHLREALDAAGHGHVKIVVSGGFTPEKIRRFEFAEIPVDVYGVGSSLVHGEGFDYTADLVLKNDEHCAKVGRGYRPNNRLHEVQTRKEVYA